MKRHTTSTPGIYYRLLKDGEKAYEITFYDSTGRRVFETVDGDFDEAVYKQNEINNKLFRGETIEVSKLTISELADIYIRHAKSGLEPSTFRRYQDDIKFYIKPLIGRRKVREFKVLHAARFVRMMEEKGLSAWTVRGALTPLSRMLSLAAREGWCFGNAVKQLDKNEKPRNFNRAMRILDRDEIQLVLQCCPPASRSLLLAAIFTGLRQGELYRLTWADVDFGASEIEVKKAKTQAGERIVVVPGFVLQDLSARSLESHSKAVFHSGKITQQSWAGEARKSLSTALERAGVTDRVRFHDLRHTFASILIGQGHDVAYVAQQMGHANASITLAIYTKLFDSKKRMEEGRRMMDRDFASITLLSQAMKDF